MKKYKAKKVKGKKVDEHRLVMQKHLRRRLFPQEVVHHIDGNKENNDIHNLVLFPSKSAHAKYHFEKGDLKIKAGDNKKVLINGKLKCCNCGKLKDLKEFITKSIAFLGVVGTCKECEKIQRRK